MSKSAFVAKLRELWDSASAYTLLTIASLGILYDVLDRLGLNHIIDPIGRPEQVLILLVAALCGGLGAERLLTLRDIQTDIKEAKSQREGIIAEQSRISGNIEQLLHKLEALRADMVARLKGTGRKEDDIMAAVKWINKTELLANDHEIEAAALRLIDDCDDNDTIKATGQYRTQDGLSREYYQHLADRVAKAKKHHGSMALNVIVSLPMPDEREEDEHIRAFRDAKVEERLIMRFAQQRWPFEVLIGRRSMIIAVLGGEKKSKYEVGVRISDEAFVATASDWYRQVAWDGALRAQ